MRGFQGGTASVGSSPLSSFNTYSTGISGRSRAPRRASNPLAHSMRWSGAAGGGLAGARPAGLASNVFINNRLSAQPMGSQPFTGQRVGGPLRPTNAASFSRPFGGQGLGFRQIPQIKTQRSGMLSQNNTAVGSAFTSLESFDFDLSGNAGGSAGKFSPLSSDDRFSSLSPDTSLASKDGLAGRVLPQNLHLLKEGRTLLTGLTLGSKTTSFGSLGSRGLLGRGR